VRVLQNSIECNSHSRQCKFLASGRPPWPTHFSILEPFIAAGLGVPEVYDRGRRSWVFLPFTNQEPIISMFYDL